MAESEGSTVPAEFSARLLFKKMRSTVRPVPAMIRAVHIIKQAGERESFILLTFHHESPFLTILIFPRL